jgi:hypothetical protein
MTVFKLNFYAFETYFSLSGPVSTYIPWLSSAHKFKLIFRHQCHSNYGLSYIKLASIILGLYLLNKISDSRYILACGKLDSNVYEWNEGAGRRGAPILQSIKRGGRPRKMDGDLYLRKYELVRVLQLENMIAEFKYNFVLPLEIWVLQDDITIK